jgi:hypothetical protein
MNVRPHDPYSPAGPSDPILIADQQLARTAKAAIRFGETAPIEVVAAMRDAEAAAKRPRSSLIKALDKRYEALAEEAAAALEASVAKVLADAEGKSADELQAMYEAEEAGKGRKTLLEKLDDLIDAQVLAEEKAHADAVAAADASTDADTAQDTADSSEGAENPAE